MAGSQVKQPQYSLESVAIFRDLPPQALERVKRLCRSRSYASGELIIDHLDNSDDVFFLLTGDARVTIRSADGKAVSFRELGPGGMFGEYAAIDGRPRSANVEARTPCLVVSMPGAAFRELAATEPKVAKTLLEHFVREIRELTTRVYEFSTLAVRYRIQAELLRLTGLSAPEGNIARIVPAPTHAEIASARARTARPSPENSIAWQRWGCCNNGAASCGSRMSIGWPLSCTTPPATTRFERSSWAPTPPITVQDPPPQSGQRL